MGITVDQYRCRIGLFIHSGGKVSSSSNLSQSQGFSLSLKLLPFATLVLLLVIAGVELNLGPTVLQCKYCKLNFGSVASYCNHMKVHKMVKKFTIPCCFCSRQMKLSSFESHVTRFHRNMRSRPQIQPIKTVQCYVCKEELRTKKDYTDHMLRHMKAGVEVKCVLTNCESKFLDVRKFQKHMSRCHSRPESSGFVQPAAAYSVSEAGLSNGAEDSENEGDDIHDTFYDCSEGTGTGTQCDDEDPYPEHVIKDELARFYLKLEGEFVIPSSTVQVISEEIKLISELSHHRLKIALKQQLEATSLDKSVISSIVKTTFRCDPIFNVHHKNEGVEQLCTHYLRRQYWKKRFPYVDPETHYFGVNQAGKRREAQFVSIRETLKILLKDEKVKDMVLKSFEKQRNGSFILRDFTDGEGYIKHQCQHPDGKCIQLLLFQDAFEFNAFGPSASVFKTIGFYYLLANLDPEFRSKVDVNQLAGLVLEKDTVPTQQEELDGKDVLKEAIKPLLVELEDLKINGIDVNGENIPVCLLYLIGDSLGQHTVGGYVRNFTCDFFCRFCTISKAEFLSNPSEVKPLRTPAEYDAAVAIAQRKWEAKRKHCLRVSEKLTRRKAKKQAEKVVARMSAPASKKLMSAIIAKDAFRKMCAVSFRAVKYRPSPFNSEVTKFHVSSPAMPPCIAHDIFEGILKCVLPRIMSYFINEKNGLI